MYLLIEQQNFHSALCSAKRNPQVYQPLGQISHLGSFGPVRFIYQNKEKWRGKILTFTIHPQQNEFRKNKEGRRKSK